MLNNQFSINLATCSVHINFSPDGLVCDICTLSGERMVGTWISAEEIDAGKVAPAALPGASKRPMHTVSKS